MSEQPKYILITYPDDVGRAGIARRIKDDRYEAVEAAETVALLNTPPQPAGIVWRKPGEAGRVSGREYIAWWHDGIISRATWQDGEENDGWIKPVIAWAEINPPAWATGGAA